MAWLVDHQRAVHRQDGFGVNGVGQGDRCVHRSGVGDDHLSVALGLAAGQLGFGDSAG
jgi:hypothetical protein